MILFSSPVCGVGLDNGQTKLKSKKRQEESPEKADVHNDSAKLNKKLYISQKPCGGGSSCGFCLYFGALR